MSCPDVSPAEERRSGLERRRPSAPALPRLTIIAISVAFGEFWNDLAADLDVAIDLFARDVEAIPFGPDTAAVIVAAGGAEDDAIRWLASHSVPRHIALFVVGTDPARRTGMQMIAQGAGDYFALPEDLEILRNAVAGTREHSSSGRPEQERKCSRARSMPAGHAEMRPSSR